MEITIREWKENFLAGKYDAKDFDTQVAAGWYDWFCSTNALAGRLKKFGKLISKIENDFLLDNYYVWFKNNCPMVGPLYDDVRFEPLNKDLRGKLYFVISVDDKRSDHKYEIWTHRTHSTEFAFDDSRQVVKFLNSWEPKLYLNKGEINNGFLY